MFCVNCGQKLPDQARFCTACGSPVEDVAAQQSEPPRRNAAAEPVASPQQTTFPEPDGVDTVLREMNLGKKSGKLAGFLIGIVAAAVVFAVVLALKVGLPGGGTDTVEGPGFDSPEEAAEAYLEALKAGNVEEMLSAFAVETYVHRMDIPSYLAYYKVYTIQNNMPLPNGGAIADGINIVKRQASINNAITRQYVMLLDPESPLLETTPILLGESDDQDQVRTLLPGNGTESLARMQVGAYRTDIVSSYYNEIVERGQLSDQAKIYGADEIQPLAIEVTVNGRDYLFCPDAVRYDETWYLLELNGILGMLTSYYNTGLTYMEEGF